MDEGIVNYQRTNITVNTAKSNLLRWQFETAVCFIDLRILIVTSQKHLSLSSSTHSITFSMLRNNMRHLDLIRHSDGQLWTRTVGLFCISISRTVAVHSAVQPIKKAFRAQNVTGWRMWSLFKYKPQKCMGYYLHRFLYYTLFYAMIF
jgi:hypothetical protein